MLRSVGMCAEAVGADREVVQKLIRKMVKQGEVFERSRGAISAASGA